MSTSTPSLAIHFEPDGYDMKAKKLKGRQVAGHGFLRALAKDADPTQESILAYSTKEKSANILQQMLNELQPGLAASWCPKEHANLLAKARTLHLPDPGVGTAASIRLRGGIDK